MSRDTYRRITVRAEGQHFSVYCTKHSWEQRNEAVIQWINHLAHRLHWKHFELETTDASVQEATKREHALFDHRYPVD